MADEKPSTGPDAEAIAVWQVPSPTANKFYLYSDGHTIRLVFAEQGGPELPAVMRTAVAINPQSALALSSLLRNFLAPIEQQSAEQAKQTTSAEKTDG